MLDEKLICVCNDNANCFYNQTLNVLFDLPREVRFCIAANRGYCYKSFYESTRRQHRSKSRNRASKIYPKLLMEIDESSKKDVHKYGCLHFSPFVLLMCNEDDSENQNNKIISCCKNKNACNFDLNMSELTRSNTLPLIKRSEYSQDRISYGHGLYVNDPFSLNISTSLGPEILIRKGSNSIPNGFHKFLDSNPVDHHFNGLQILSIFIPAVIMVGIIAILLFTKCTVSKYFPKRRRKWAVCISSNQSKMTTNSSSAASTRSTTLQDSQSFSSSSSQITRSKVQQGKILIHKLENLKLLSQNLYSFNYSAKYEDESVNLRLLPLVNSPRSFMLWKRLVSIHDRCVLRHSNLSSIKAADVCMLSELRQCNSENRPSSSPWFSPSTVCAFTVKEFHPYGSFMDIILQNSPVELSTSSSSTSKFALGVIKDIVNGVTFLHTDMAGTRGRPALAHRNICLENIYLKADGITACIGGLEYGICALPSPPPLPIEQLLLAYDTHLHEFGSTSIQQDSGVISSTSESHELSIDEDSRIPIDTVPLFPDWWPVCGLQVGLPVYMAPEILEEIMFPFCFESHKRADVYALSIAIWEILAWAVGTRPYHEWIPRHSDIKRVKKLVCERDLRPTLNLLEETSVSIETDDNSEVTIRKLIFEFFIAILPECWNHNPEERLSSLRIKKDLAKFHEECIHQKSNKL